MANDNKDNESASSEKDRFHAFCWTAEDVARELKCSKRMVVKLVHLDRIPYAKVGRLVRFCPARIKEWLAQGGTRWGKQAKFTKRT
jgi:excisionase family DNA binding protein